MSDRLPSGSPRLDLVLGGGLPADAINLIIGRPGTGKTILAQQYLFRNATEERPALYLSTVSEPLEKILRYGQSLSFFDRAAVGSRVIYEDLGQTLNNGRPARRRGPVDAMAARTPTGPHGHRQFQGTPGLRGR